MSDHFSALHRQASEMLIQAVHDRYNQAAALEGLEEAAQFGSRARDSATNVRQRLLATGLLFTVENIRIIITSGCTD